MLRISQICLFYLMLLWLGTMLLIGNTLCLPLLLTSRKFREPIAQQLISAVFRLFLYGAVSCKLMQLDLGDLDSLNGQRKMLLVSNHPSMIDVFLVISRVRKSTCLMKSSIGSNIFLGVGAYLAGYVSNSRIDVMLRNASLAVAKGNLLLIFPEGTRTTRQPINVIKPGVALISKRTEAALQTIIIVTNSAYLSKGWSIFRPPIFPLVYRAWLGDKFLYSGSTTQTTHKLQSYFENTIAKSIDPNIVI